MLPLSGVRYIVARKNAASTLLVWQRLRRLTLGVLLLVPGFSQSEDSPSYRVVGAILERAKRDDLNSLKNSVRTLAPYMKRLSDKYGEELLVRFDEGIAVRNRDAVIDTIILMAVLQAREGVESCAKDELTGWKNARLRAGAAFLSFDAVTNEARARYPSNDEEVAAGFVRLAVALKSVDLTTDPIAFEMAKDALLGRLKRMAKTLTGAKSRKK